MEINLERSVGESSSFITLWRILNRSVLKKSYKL